MSGSRLVLSRSPGEAIVIGDREVLLTVAAIRADLVRLHTDFKSRIGFDFTLRRDDRETLAPEITCELLDVRGEKAWIGIRAPLTLSVHRKEVYDVIRRAKRGGGSDGADPAGAPVPRNPKPGADDASVRLPPPTPEP